MPPRSDAFLGTFALRRIHSLLGVWLVIFLVEHLIVNSQAALWLKQDGIGFVRLVNLLEALPYLQIFETVFIAIPILVHGYWGVKRALSAKINSFSSDGSSPSLKYGRNKAYTWQRLSSWVLLFGILFHVVQMRFIEQPKKVGPEFSAEYRVEVTDDAGLKPVAERIGVKLLYKKNGVVEVSAASPGKAMLMMVRNTFKSWMMCSFYTLFLLAATFHAFNGLWTSFITWGVLLSYRSQKAALPICWILMAVITFLGLAAIWGSYWLTLRN